MARAIHAKSQGSYGSRRMKRALCKEGYKMGLFGSNKALFIFEEKFHFEKKSSF